MGFGNVDSSCGVSRFVSISFDSDYITNVHVKQ